MTDGTRETLELAVAYHAAKAFQYREELDEALAQKHDRVRAALRDVLTPRTCGTCRHSVEHKRWNTGETFIVCGNSRSIACPNTVLHNDGCIRGWQAREGEGGTR